MWARTNSLVLCFTAVATLTFTGCSGSSPSSPTPPTTAAIHNEWTWRGGPNIPSQGGIYGTQGEAAPTNIPSAREDAISWVDASGDFWLFGGFGNGSSIFPPPFNNTNVTVVPEYQNDLWNYRAGQWTWMGGSESGTTAGVYGTLGVAAPGNNPGARSSSAHWLDASGSLWLFGGQTFTMTGLLIDLDGHAHLNDLWKYTAGQWTWMGGSNVGEQTELMGLREPLRPPTSLVDASMLPVGPIRPATSGSSAETASMRTEHRVSSMISGSTAQDNGHGWEDRPQVFNPASMAPMA
jgi:hypothetical protein